MENNLSKNSFERSILFYPDVDNLIKHFTDNSEFTILLNKFKNISADIFACHNLFENFPKNTYMNFLLENITINQDKKLDDILSILKLQHNYTKEEVYITILIILYLFLQEVVYGPSFFSIRETEKVDFKKDLEKFNNHFFFKLEENLNHMKDEMRDYLTQDGEAPYPNSKLLILYILVKEFFKNNENEYSQIFNTFYLWKSRIFFLHQKMIREPVFELKENIFKSLNQFDINSILQKEDEVDHSQQETLIKNNNIIKGMLQLEKSYYNLKYYKYKDSSSLIEETKDLFNLKINLTGKLGRRTKFQVFDVPVLIVESESSTLEENNEDSKPNILSLNEENPLLERPNITDDTFLHSNYTELSLFDQMYVTALINNLKVSLPDEDLLRDIILTYTGKSLEKSYDWLVYSKLLLQKSIAEDKKSKTVERSLLQIQSLCDQHNDRSPTPYTRLKYIFTVDYPFSWNMKKHYAEMFMGYGAVLTAFDIFEELGMSEECIQCLYIAGKNERALQYAQEVLKKKEDPGVYCILGEIQVNEEYFHKALEVSKNKYTRAYRCLGKFHFSVKGDLEKALEYYLKALEINPLFPNVWFTVGCINLRLKNWEEAIKAFSKCVSIDENNSEGWANLGLAFNQVGKLKEAMKSLETGLKASRSNWKICENLMFISIDAKDMNKLIYSINHLYNLDKSDRIKPSVFYSLTTILLSIYHNLTESQIDYYKGKVYEIFEKFSMKDGVTPEVWDLYALFVESAEIDIHKEKVSEEIKGQVYLAVMEIRLKQVRGLMVADIWEKDEKIIEKVAKVVTKIENELNRINDEQKIKDIEGFMNNIKTKIEKFYKLKEIEQGEK